LRVVGAWGLAAGIINVTIGGGIFRLPASAASVLGSAAPLGYVICAIAMGLIVLCFAEAGSRVARTGGLYAYVQVAFGPLVGFLCGVLLWAGITAAMSAVASFLGDALAALIPALAAPLFRALAIVALIVIVTALNVAGMRGATRFNAVVTAAKLLPLAVFIVAGLIAAPWHQAASAVSLPAHASSLGRGSVLIIFAFLGVESALVPSGEVRDPARSVPRAIGVSLLVITLVYLMVQVVAQALIGSALAGAANPVARAAGVALGPWGREMILVGAAISMFGYMSGMILAVPRMLFAFGRDGFLPRGIASVHPRYHTPWVAIMVQAGVVAALALSGSFERLAIVANGSVLLVYAACVLALLELRRRDVHIAGAAPFRIPLGGLVPVLAFAIIAWLLSSLTSREWLSLLVPAGLAVVIYVASHASRSSPPALAISTAERHEQP
jgi:amino acid transporter